MPNSKAGPPCDVAILTFGKFASLLRTIRSVAEQDYPIKTLVLSDDGSGIPFPGEAVELLEKLYAEGRFQELIVRSNHENQGTVTHLNHLASLCDGLFLKFLSCGDAFDSPGSLRSLVTFAGNHDDPVVTSLSVVCSESLERELYTYPRRGQARALNRPGEGLYPILCVQNCISALGCLFRRDFFTVYGGFDAGYRLLEDWPTWLRLSRNGGNIPLLNQVTCRYGIGGVSSQDGNAYLATALREDMIRCYEREILPFLDRLSLWKRHVTLYYYRKLVSGDSTAFWMKYPHMELLFSTKRLLKRSLLRWRG